MAGERRRRMAKQSVSKQVLLDGAQMALSGFLAGTLGFLKEQNISIQEWVSYIGEQFEGSLGALEGEEVGRVMEHLLTLQVLPLGAEVTSSQATRGKVEVKLTPLPSRAVLEKFGTTPRELLRGFAINQNDFEAIYGMYESAAKAIGLRFTHQLKGGQEVLSLEPAPSGSRRAKKA
jgi:hypothetical protein